MCVCVSLQQSHGAPPQAAGGPPPPQSFFPDEEVSEDDGEGVDGLSAPLDSIKEVI